MRVYLTGFMGSGKTQVGAGLARLLSYTFIDLDDLLVKLQGLSIREQFERFGESAFRESESHALHQTASMEQAVIACGGGTPCYFDNMDWMNQHGVTIFLDVPVAVLTARLQPEKASRPLLQALTDESLPRYIDQKLRERLPYYQKAKLTIDANLPAPELCDLIFNQLSHKFL